MTIRNFQHYANAVWDWSILRGCFGNSQISPTDIDGIIERNGYQLVIETKVPGSKIPTGQLLTLKSFVAQGHSVLIIWGESGNPEAMQLLTPTKTLDFPNGSVALLKEIVKKWYETVNAKGRKTPEREAREILNRKGKAYVNAMAAEWAKSAEMGGAI